MKPDTVIHSSVGVTLEWRYAKWLRKLQDLLDELPHRSAVISEVADYLTTVPKDKNIREYTCNRLEWAAQKLLLEPKKKHLFETLLRLGEELE